MSGPPRVGGARIRDRLASAVSWTPPTSTEIGVVAKSGLAAGLSWWLAGAVTDLPDPILAPLTAIVVVQVSVRASVRTALQRSGAVVLGVVVAVVVGDALGLNGVTIGLLVGLSLGVAQLVLRLPPASARQVPVSILVVLTTVTTTSQASYGWRRGLESVLGAAVGVVVSLVLPASRVVDASQTLERLGTSLAEVLGSMGRGLEQPWSTEQTVEWRRQARTARDRLLAQTEEAVGNVVESARWNVRDRRHVRTLGRYEEVLPRLERTAIGTSVISRGLDDHARLSGSSHRPMASMGALLCSLATVVRALTANVLAGAAEDRGDLGRAFDVLRARRDRCVVGASRRARLALAHEDDPDGLEGEWLGYAALLVQVDRIIADLRAPLPA
ncbi:MAG TPA: aromatic acid exporter family protein [Acidimicrobiales bacterium]|nr:aromatic acid exporter family protein [Acidimicrobiales bacterium]